MGRARTVARARARSGEGGGVMASRDLEIIAGIVVPAGELHESASRAGGPGGQHVNKTSTRVTLRWNVRESAALDEETRARLLERLGPRLTRGGELVVHVADERSRARNRETARERLADLVAGALHTQETRVHTRPTRASRERRLREKRRRSDVKQTRRSIDDESN